MDEIKSTLNQLYNNPESPAAFSGVDTLYKEAKKKLGSKISRKDVEYYLQGHRTYSLMRPRRVHFKRAKTIPLGFMSDIQTDLAEMGALSRSNNGHRYILVAIDVLSKRLFAIPLKTKKAEDMLQAFKILLDQMPFKPIRIYSDLGTEYRNKLLKEFFENEEIQKLETSSSFVKAALAERAIRNLKQRLYRYFSQTKTLNWIDVLQKIVDGINHAPSRTHGMRPIDVNFKNARKVWQRQYGDEFKFKRRRMKPKFLAGDTVRMSRGKHIFEKGYIPSWGDEILTVDSVKTKSKPILYKIRDDKGEKFKGSFYGEELAKVRKDADTTYRIEKTYRKKKRPDGTFDVLVKFIGYPEREWIHESQLQP